MLQLKNCPSYYTQEMVTLENSLTESVVNESDLAVPTFCSQSVKPDFDIQRELEAKAEEERQAAEALKALEAQPKYNGWDEYMEDDDE